MGTLNHRLPKPCALFSQYITMKNRNADEIMPGLFLGSLEAAQDVEFLTQSHITHILSVIDGPPFEESPEATKHPQLSNITLKHIDVEDDPTTQLLPFFDVCCRYIHHALATGNVLVHCGKGISRSATIVIAYLMWSQRLSLDESLWFVYTKRRIIAPNLGFLFQLQTFDHILKNQRQVKPTTHRVILYGFLVIVCSLFKRLLL